MGWLSSDWVPAFPGRSRFIAGMAVEAVARGLYIPLSTMYFHVVGGLPLVVVGLGLTIAAVIGLAGNPIGGTLIDRNGPLAVVMGCYVVRAVGFLGYLLVSSLPALVLFAALVAISDRAYGPAIQALFTEISAGVRRERLLAIYRTLRNGGFGLGSAVAASLLAFGRGGFTVILLACATGFLCSAGLLAGVRGALNAGHRLRTGPAIGYRTVLRDGLIVRLSLNNVPVALCYNALNGLLPLFVAFSLHLPVTTAGLLVATNAVVVTVAQLPVSRLQESSRRTRGSALGALFLAASCLMFAAAGWLSWRPALLAGLWVAILVYTAGELIHATASKSLASDIGPAEARGRYLSVYQMSYSLSGVAAPFLFTVALALPSAVVWVALAVGAAASAANLVHLERSLPAAAVLPSDLITDDPVPAIAPTSSETTWRS